VYRITLGCLDSSNQPPRRLALLLKYALRTLRMEVIDYEEVQQVPSDEVTSGQNTDEAQ
jgi:hypothetical protein